MRIGADAVNAALADFQRLGYQSQVAAAYEAFLTAKWLEANGGEPPSFSSVGRAVPAVFAFLPDHPLGRLAPFKYDWIQVADTGRKTVWNNNSRGGNKRSLTLFNSNDIRNGLRSNAASLLEAMLPAQRPSRQSLAVLLLRAHSFDAGDTWATADELLRATTALSDEELAAVTSPAPLGSPLLSEPEWAADLIAEPLRPLDAVVVQTPATPATAGAATIDDEQPLSVVVDSRVERMLRLAIASYTSIMLVGPPGTGKGTLLRWMFGEIAADPERHGFEAGFVPDPVWRTPDESWSAFELIGGLAPNEEGVLRWSMGVMLNALSDNRWLVLDETNRADMDKIMGPLLTWLSRQEVEIGRTMAHGGEPIRIGWSTSRQSELHPEGGSGGHRFLAGRDWRLIGTFNPQDAQRVFRFGQALSRRFVIVPVPAVRPGQCQQLLESAYPNLMDAAAEAIVSLYTAHLADEVTALGPAIFLGMARYLMSGLPASSADGPPATEPGEPAENGPGALLAELLAESYVLAAGRYLAGYEDRAFEELAIRVVDEEGALTAEQWTWIRAQRNILS